MRIKEHIVYGGAASIALSPVFGAKSILFFLASVLIDLDHYIDYLYYSRLKNWSIKTMFRFHYQIGDWLHRPHICALEAFHTAEFFLGIFLVALYFRSAELFLILGGMSFHLMLDLIRLYQWKKINVRALSFIEYAVRRRKMVREHGVHPEDIFNEAYRAVTQQDGRLSAEKFYTPPEPEKVAYSPSLV